MKKIILAALLISTPVSAAEIDLGIKAKIISFEDTVQICGEENYPDWCPDHLIPDAPKEEIQEVQFSEEHEAWKLNEVEPAEGKVYE